MPLFNSPERAARKAERERMFAAEEARAKQRRLDDQREQRQRRHARTGYGQSAGYGVTIHTDGTVDIGSADMGDLLHTTLAGSRAALETLESARSRVTATRLVALGVLAFAVPKHDRRMVMTITSPGGFEAVIVVDGSDEVNLRQWIAWFNRKAALAAEQEAAGGPQDVRPGD